MKIKYNGTTTPKLVPLPKCEFGKVYVLANSDGTPFDKALRLCVRMNNSNNVYMVYLSNGLQTSMNELKGDLPYAFHYIEVDDVMLVQTHDSP